MLTYSQFANLERSARDRHVLHAYIDAGELDAVARRAWRKTLAAGIAAARKTVASASHAERAEFEQATGRLAEVTRQLPDDLEGAPGWAALVTADGVLQAGPTLRAPEAYVGWRLGIAAAPYLRALQGPADVILALIDARTADLYRLHGGGVERVGRINAHAHVGRAAHMGDVAREGFHSGTRGTTLTDAAQRALEVGRERMLHEVAQELEGLARPSGWIVVAGTRTNANDAIKRLGRAAQKRATYMSGLSADASEAEIATAAAEGRRRLSSEREVARVAELLDRAIGRARAVVGLEEVRGAIRSGAARDVLITPAYFETHGDEAESVALDLLSHGARLSEVGGEAATRLDAEGGGIAATLRFPSRVGRVGAGLAAARA